MLGHSSSILVSHTREDEDLVPHWLGEGWDQKAWLSTGERGCTILQHWLGGHLTLPPVVSSRLSICS